MNKAMIRELSFLLIILLMLSVVIAAPIIINKNRKTSDNSRSDSVIVIRRSVDSTTNEIIQDIQDSPVQNLTNPIQQLSNGIQEENSEPVPLGSNPQPLDSDPQPLGAVDVSDIEILYSSANLSGPTYWDVYGINADGSNNKVISAEVDYLELTPVWSPDNLKMSYLSNESGDLDIWIMTFDDGSKFQLTFGKEPIYADWSFDGNKLVFSSDSTIDNSVSCTVLGNYDPDCNLFIINSDGFGLTQITNDSFPDIDPKWSPINDKIVFSSNRTGTFDIFTINSDGTGLTQITSGPLLEVTPAWTQDGSKIVYTQGDDIGTTFQLMIMNADGTNKQEIISFNDSAPLWPSPSPDGTQITYTWFGDDGSGDNAYIYVINTNGTGNTALTFVGYEIFSDWKNAENVTQNQTVPGAPHIQKVILTGSNFEDVEITWEASSDDPVNVDNYTISSECYISGSGYGTATPIIATGASLYTFTFPGDGDGNLHTCLYDVTANNDVGSTPADNQGGKLGRMLTDTPGNHDYLLSVPLIQYDTSLLVVLQTLDIISVQHYNTSAKSDPWKHWNKHKPSHLNDLWDIDHTMGFYISLENSDSFTVAGIVPGSTTMHLESGWNMIPYPTFTKEEVQNVFSGIGYSKVKTVEEFNPNYKKMGDTDLMKPGQGYWVFLDGSHDWTVDW